MIYDKRAAANLIGCLMNKPELLSNTDQYILTKEDFDNTLHRIIFSSIYNLYHQGAGSITINDLHSYLKKYPALYNTFNEQEGSDFVLAAEENAEVENFSIYYDRVKKLSLLRKIKSEGFNIDRWYAEGSYDINQRQILEKKLEDATMHEIVLDYQGTLSEIESTFINKKSFYYSKLNEGIEELIEELQKTPELGMPLQGKIFTTVSRGARKKKFYIMSGSTGSGKTRFAVGNACYLAYPIRWNLKKGCWENTGSNQKILFITTELGADEIQTMVIANISGINEEKILNGTYTREERKRVQETYAILREYEDNFHLYHMPDPNVNQLNSNVRRLAISKKIQAVFFDYIHTSPALLMEFSGTRIREDVALGLLSTALKNLANELDIFVWSGTQLNASARDTDFLGIHCIRGSKAIADKTDFMCAIKEVDNESLKTISTLLKAGYPRPNMYMDIFKNRRGRYVQVRIWMNADRGICRVEDLFITNEYGEEQPIDLLYAIDETAECNIQEVISKKKNELPHEKKRIHVTL